MNPALKAFIIALLIFSTILSEASNLAGVKNDSLTPQIYRRHSKTARLEASPSLTQINSYINQIKTPFSHDIVKAMFWLESGWSMEDGPDIGIGQINEKMVRKFYPVVNVERLKTDWQYNIRISCQILSDKLDWAKRRKRMEGWREFCFMYRVENLSSCELAVLAYNGVKVDHAYLRLVKRYAIEKPWKMESEQ